jgi:hypothetical protein
MPQKGQAGCGVCWERGEDAGPEDDAREGREKKDAGASEKAHLAQQLQYHRGFPGHTCHRGNNRGLFLLN